MKLINKIVILILCIPFVFLVRILRPFVLIQFCEIRSDRIGHFVIDSILKIFANNETNRQVTLYYFSSHVSNSQWERMLLRKIKVYTFVKYLSWANIKISGGKLHEKIININYSRDINGLLYKNKNTKLHFTLEENIWCEEVLIKLGWKRGEKIICLLVRDNAYLEEHYKSTNNSYNYHDYRNSNVDDYIPGINYLNKKKYWVFRMGKVMSRPVNYFNKYFVDYAFSESKSDLLDIWLFANCDACISTGSGLDTVSLVYEKPILFLNFLPLSTWWSFANSTTYFKSLFWCQSGNSLKLQEYFENSYFDDYQYTSRKIKIKNMSSDEIKSAIKEFVYYLEKNTYKHNKINITSQNLFKTSIDKNKKISKFHKWYHPKSFIGNKWLRD
jgi:putative glycosyltransferase (TIGR04372 family)